jgi:hypothetical protein
MIGMVTAARSASATVTESSGSGTGTTLAAATPAVIAPRYDRGHICPWCTHQRTVIDDGGGGGGMQSDVRTVTLAELG